MPFEPGACFVPKARTPGRQLGVLIPGPQVREGVDRVAAGVPARRGPLLEVQVAGGRVAGLADVADELAGLDGLALGDERGLAQVHVGVVLAGAGAVDDQVVAGVALEAAELRLAAAGR